MTATQLNPRGPRQATSIFIFVTAALDVVSLGIVMPVFPSLIEQLATSKADAGWLNGVFVALWALMQFFASPVLGALSDRFGRRPVILISTAGLAFDYVLMALAPNLAWLVVGRILGGLTAANIGAVYAYMADITPPAQRARAFGLIGAAFSAGFILGPLIGGVAGEWGLRAPFWVAAALSGLAFVYGLFVLPESLPVERRMAFSWQRANPIGALKLLRSHPQLPLLAGVNFAVNFCHYVFHTVFVLYAAHRFGFGSAGVGVLLALTSVLDVFVQAWLVGRCVNAFGDSRVLRFGLFAGVVGLLAMGLAPNAAGFIAGLCTTTLWGMTIPTLQSLMSRRVSESEQGQLQGANLSVGAIAGIGAPLVFGAVYTWATATSENVALLGAPFVLAAAFLLIAALLGRRA